MRKILFGVTSYDKQCKNLRNIRAYLATRATQVQKGRENNNNGDSTIKGTTYEGENREKKRGIYEKRKTKKGGGRKNRE